MGDDSRKQTNRRYVSCAVVVVAYNGLPKVESRKGGVIGMTEILFRVKGPQGEAISNAAVLAAYPNETYLTGQTDSEGELRLELYRTDQKMKILVAGEGYLPLCTETVPENPQNVELEPSKDGRSGVLFTRSTGYIPGVSGRLNPHKDGYVYGDNIAINGRLAYPAVHFKIGEDLRLLDVYGVETTIRFIVAEGQFSLIEHTEPKAYKGE